MYFRTFQQETILQIAGSCHKDVWRHLVLQATYNEVPLRQLVASLGALTKAKGLECIGQDARHHSYYAFQQYSQGLKGIQALLAGDQGAASARSALVAALLIYCFENMNGQLEGAIVHMKKALGLMQMQFSSSTQRYRHLLKATPSHSLEHDLVAALVRLDTNFLSRVDGASPSEPTANTGCINYELRVWLDNLRPSILNIDYGLDNFDVPRRFNDIVDARVYLEYIQWWALPVMSKNCSPHLEGLPASDTTKEICRTIISQLRQWKVAFEPLFVDTYISGGNSHRIAALILRAQALSYGVVANKIESRGAPSAGLFVDDSREVLEVSRYVVHDPAFHRGFVFDFEIIPSIFIVGVCCPDLSLCKEALELLKETVPRVEGGWDSTTLVKVVSIAIQMAEQNSHSAKAIVAH